MWVEDGARLVNTGAVGKRDFVNGQHAFVNAIGARGRRSLARFAVVAAAGLLLWRLGPFGTFADLAPGERLAYWLGLTALQWLLSVAALQLLRPFAAPRVAAIVAAAVLAAIPVSFAVAWAEMLLRVERDLGPADLLGIAGDVALIGVPLLLITHGLLAVRNDEPTPEPRADTLMAQVPPEKRGRLHAIEAEDHYVRVHTERGQHLLLMRFGDALGAVPAAAGAQVHRGWWVARDAAVAEHRTGDRLQLELSDGTRVPVSRTYVRSARESGLIR